MQIVTEPRQITAAGMQASRAFTVKAGAHIMTVLSGLYADPKDAMVREYLTNMYDAYLMLAKSKGMTIAELVASPAFIPPVLSVPTGMAPELVFRDNGIGMDMETVWNVYTSYGESTKNADNDTVGGFGLGSKTAFCYNGGATWTVEARKDGRAHLFMAAIGSDNVPRLDHVQSMDTTEHPGVTVRIPIRRQDMMGVIAAAEKYLPYFPLPITVEGTTLTKSRAQYAFRGDAWGMSGSRHRHAGGEITVVMGNVPYTVSEHGSFGRLQDLVPRPAGASYELMYFFMQNRFDLFVPVGSVDIVPSRDNLKYTDRTIAAIRTALTRVLKELPTSVSDTLTSCTTEWEAMMQMKKIAELPYMEAVVPRATWRGAVVDPAIGIARNRKDFIKLDPTMALSLIGTSSTDRSKIEELDRDELTMREGDETVVVRDDLPKGAIGATKALLYHRLVSKTSNGRARRYGHKVGHAVLIKSSLTDAQIQAFFGGMPATHIINASTLTGYKLPANARGSSKDTLYRLSPMGRWEARVNVPTADPMYYYLPLTKSVHSTRFDYEVDGMDSETLVRIARGLNVLVNGQIVYGIKTTDVGNFDAAVWKNLNAAVQEAIRTYVQNNRDAMKLSNASPTGESGALADLLGNVWKIETAHPLFQSLSQVKSATNTHTAVKQFGAIRQYRGDDKFNKEIDKMVQSSTAVTFDQAAKAVVDKFPLLGTLAHMWCHGYRHTPPTSHKKSVLAYIDATR